jgi:hypothetical protein
VKGEALRSLKSTQNNATTPISLIGCFSVMALSSGYASDSKADPYFTVLCLSFFDALSSSRFLISFFTVSATSFSEIFLLPFCRSATVAITSLTL